MSYAFAAWLVVFNKDASMTKSTSSASILDQLNPESLQAEIDQLVAERVAIQKKIDAIETLLKAVVIARDGKVRKKWTRKKKEAKPEVATAANKTTATYVPAPKASPDSADDRYSRVLLQVVSHLEKNGPSTCVQISDATVELNADVRRILLGESSRFKSLPGGLWALK